MSKPKTTLYVANISCEMRAKELAQEFERYGRLVRCDIPAIKLGQRTAYGFIEFEDPRDAQDAYDEMHGKRILGHVIRIEWSSSAGPKDLQRSEQPSPVRDHSHPVKDLNSSRDYPFNRPRYPPVRDYRDRSPERERRPDFGPRYEERTRYEQRPIDSRNVRRYSDERDRSPGRR